MIKSALEKAASRREFLRGGIRYTLLTVVAAVAAAGAKVRRDPLAGQTCDQQGLCRGCGLFAGCGLPQALSAKQALPPGRNLPATPQKQAEPRVRASPISGAFEPPAPAAKGVGA